MATDTLHLEQPLLEDQLAAPFFFNGRVLTQEDLAQDRTALTTRLRHVGRAVGSGVAHGFEVEPVPGATGAGNVTLFVAPGLALAPNGQSLHLPQLVRLRFALPDDLADDATDEGAGEFDNCKPVVSVATQSTGLHLLVVRPFARKEGLAPVSGLGNEAAPCNAKYVAAGVDFRAVPFSTTADRNSPLFRNRVALECFGFGDTARRNLLADPFAFPAPLEIAIAPAPGAQAANGYGLVDDLRRKQQLAACEVPLAVVHLDDDGALGFVETWSVRRALARPPLSRHWWPFGGSDDRSRTEAEAAMYQFQDQIGALLLESGLNRPTLAATARFAFLPGGGFLPTGASRFSPAAFLGSGAQPVVATDFGRLRTLVEESWRCEVFDPASPPDLVYFDFGATLHPWVFFLRRKPEVVYIPPVSAETEASPPATEPPATTTGAKSGLLVAISRDVLAFGSPEILVADGDGNRVELKEVELEEVLELAAKNKLTLAGESQVPGRTRSRRGETTQPSLEETLQENTLFFIRIAEGAQTYAIRIRALSGTSKFVTTTVQCPVQKVTVVPIG